MLVDLFSLFFPTTCCGCGNTLFKHESVICTHCLGTLPKTNYHLQNENPLQKLFWGRTDVSYATALYYFTKRGRVQNLLHHLKYKNGQEVGVKAGTILGKELLQSENFKTVDAIIPVPLHKDKLKKRGYNQSLCFAEGISKSMEVPLLDNALFRIAASETQTRKSKFNRWQNVETIFNVSDATLIAEKHLLLVDDVITTGATLEACTKELIKAPNVKVSIACIACA